MNQRQFVSPGGYLFLCFIFFFPLAAYSQIITDGTVGSALTLDGPDYQIGQELGSRLDTNLFHSFRTFDIATGESATFTGPDDIANVISRVTGGEISRIDGLLSSRIGTADFYFVNPAGVVFGSNAQVDVPAAFHVGAADELRFADGAIFSAIEPDASCLTAVSPESFGYLTSHAGAIELTGDLVLSSSRLEFVDESSVSLSGRQVTIAGDETSGAGLTVPGGNLQISAAGDVSFEMPFGSLPTPQAGNLEITDATIVTSGDGGGELLLSAGNAAITDSNLAADNTGSTDAAGGVEIAVAESLYLYTSGIQSNVFGSGASGGIMITAPDLIIQQQSSEKLAGIFSDTGGEGNAGGIAIEAGNIFIDGQGDGAAITSMAYGSSGNAGSVSIHASGQLALIDGGHVLSFATGEGDGGDIMIDAKSMYIDGQGSESITGVTSSAWFGSCGNAGTINLHIAEELEMVNGGELSSDTWERGHAGSVTVEAGNILIDGQESDYLTGITSSAWPASCGNAGTISLYAAEELEVMNGGEISSDTWGEGDGGCVVVEADNLCIEGTHDDENGYVSGITSTACSGSSGDGGSIAIKVSGCLDMIKGGTISAGTHGEGNGGDIHIDAGEVHIESRGSRYATGMISNTFSGSSGNAGSVAVRVQDMLEITQGIIATDTAGPGRAGAITVDADQIRIVGYGDVTTVFDEPVATPTTSGWISGIFNGAEYDSGGQAGEIILTADTIEMQEGGCVTNRVWSTLTPEQLPMIEPRFLNITAGTLRLDNDSWISTGAFGNTPGYPLSIAADTIDICNSSILTSANEADGGPVHIHGDLIRLDNSLMTSSVESSGNGGDIAITSAGSIKSLILKGGFIQANAPTAARGGDIHIDVDALITEGGNLEVGGHKRRKFESGSAQNIIQAAAPGGEQGLIDITSPALDISGAVIDLNTVWMAPVHLGTDPCLDVGFSDRNTLIYRGQGGLPAGTERYSTTYFDERRLKQVLTIPDKIP